MQVWNSSWNGPVYTYPGLLGMVQVGAAGVNGAAVGGAAVTASAGAVAAGAAVTAAGTTALFVLGMTLGFCIVGSKDTQPNTMPTITRKTACSIALSRAKVSSPNIET